MSWLPDSLSPHHSKLPLMIVTSQLDPGHLWASFSLQWHFYGSSVIHLLIHSYTLHHLRVPGTRLGTGETMMSKTQPLPLRSHGQVGEGRLLPPAEYGTCQRTTSSETLLPSEADTSHWVLCPPLWPTVNPRAGSKLTLPSHHPHPKTSTIRSSELRKLSPIR